MRIATWNVNSIRARTERVIEWLGRTDVDVVAIQETKCRDNQFPYDEFDAIGYEVAHVGLNQWNGVAIASRVGITDVATHFDGQPGFSKEADLFEPPLEARAVGATCGGVRLWSLYVPNGRSLTDPHYTYKLQWLDALHACAAKELAENPTQLLALMGDWNIAPTDDDVWDPAFFDGKTHVSSAERAAFGRFIDSGFTDVVRPHAPGPGTYTYWDYTQLRFAKKQGMRIDFILGSPPLTEHVTGAHIDREERKGKGASDHAPVVVDLVLPGDQ